MKIGKQKRHNFKLSNHVRQTTYTKTVLRLGLVCFISQKHFPLHEIVLLNKNCEIVKMQVLLSAIGDFEKLK